MQADHVFQQGLTVGVLELDAADVDCARQPTNAVAVIRLDELPPAGGELTIDLIGGVSPKRTLFYPLKPIGEGSPEVESIDSFVRRLAFTHSEKPTTLMRQLLEAFPIEGAHGRTAEQIIKQINLGESVGNRVVQRLEQATGVNLSATSLSKFSRFLSTRGLRRNETGMYCPCCVQESDDVSHGRLTWELSAVTACAKHGVRLRSAKVCGAPPEEHLKPMNRPALHAVCSLCGSIGFKCISGQPARASNYEVWVARQLSELVALPETDMEAIAAKSVRKGVAAVVTAKFDGSVVQASKRAGLSRSTVCVWVKGDFVPSLEGLTRLCFAADANLVALLGGRFAPAECEQDAGTWPDAQKREYRRTALADARIREVILAAANEPVPPSAREVARSLNVHPTLLRKRFREQTDTLVASHKRYRRAESHRRYQEAVQRYTAAAASLLEAGKVVGRKNLQVLTNTVSYGGNEVVGRAMFEVVERFSAKRKANAGPQKEPPTGYGEVSGQVLQTASAETRA